MCRAPVSCSAILKELVSKFGDKLNVYSFDAARKPGDVEGVTYFRGDLCKPSQVALALSGAECVIHTAALLEYASSKPSDVTMVNETGTRILAETCLEKDVKYLIHTSSGRVAELLYTKPSPLAI